MLQHRITRTRILIWLQVHLLKTVYSLNTLRILIVVIGPIIFFIASYHFQVIYIEKILKLSELRLNLINKPKKSPLISFWVFVIFHLSTPCIELIYFFGSERRIWGPPLCFAPKSIFFENKIIFIGTKPKVTSYEHLTSANNDSINKSRQ